MNSSSTDVRAALAAKGYGMGRGVRDTWARPAGKTSGSKPAAQAAVRSDPKAAMYAKGRLKAGEMNATERAYHQHLAQRQHAGEIVWFKFEGVKLRLADNTFYTPDFMVMGATGLIEMHEVKGFWMDDARAKIKIAAEMYPFRFYAIKKQAKKNGGGWDVEAF